MVAYAGFTFYTMIIAFLPCICYEIIFPYLFPAPLSLGHLQSLIVYYLRQCQPDPLLPKSDLPLLHRDLLTALSIEKNEHDRC